MKVKKYKPLSPNPFINKIKGDTEFARLGHLNNLADQVNNAISAIPTPPPAVTPSLQDILNVNSTASNKGITLNRTIAGRNMNSTFGAKYYDSLSTNIGKVYNSNDPWNSSNIGFSTDYNNTNQYGLWDFGFGGTSSVARTSLGGNPYSLKQFLVYSNQPGSLISMSMRDDFFTNAPGVNFTPNYIEFFKATPQPIPSIKIDATNITGTGNVLTLPSKTGTLAIEDTTAYTGSIVVGSQTLNFVNGILKTVV